MDFSVLFMRIATTLFYSVTHYYNMLNFAIGIYLGLRYSRHAEILCLRLGTRSTETSTTTVYKKASVRFSTKKDEEQTNKNWKIL
jgi:hypothetical protein